MIVVACFELWFVNGLALMFALVAVLLLLLFCMDLAVFAAGLKFWGVDHAKNQKEFPKTMALFNRVPGLISVSFSQLQPSESHGLKGWRVCGEESQR